VGALGAQLGQGGQARVLEAPGIHLSDVAGPLVYKEYLAGQAPKVGPQRLVALRNSADPARRAELDARTAWPVRVVVDAGAVVGLLLPRIPDPFFHDRLLPSGAPLRHPREVQSLFIGPDLAQNLGLPTPSPEQRLALCRDFATTVEFLHDGLGVAFGDINARNAIFRLDAEPMVMFVDCDAARRFGDMAAVPQLNAPDWEPPEGGDVLSRSTDLYKLGLFVLRCLTPGSGSSVNRDPAVTRHVLDAAGMALLRAAVEGPPGQRPPATQWIRYLRRSLGEAVAPPRLLGVRLNRTMVAAGEPLTVSWVVEETDEVVVSGNGCPTVTADGDAGTVDVYPARTGNLRVTARNVLGEDTCVTAQVGVFDVPSAQWPPVPMPRPTLPDLSRAFPDVAALVLPPPPVPRAVAGVRPSGPTAIPPGWEPDDPAMVDDRSDAPVDITSIMFGAGQDGAPTQQGANS
jgi:hypothetical protein